MKDVQQRIEALCDAAGGSWGMMLKDLDDGSNWGMNEKQPYTAASIIKIPIMATVLQAHEAGDFQLEDKIILRNEDLVGGAGVLQHMTPGIELTVYDLIMLMIIQSDNTATNRLIDLVGKHKIQQFLQAHGFEGTSFYNKLMIVPAKREGPNLVTAADMVRLLVEIAQGRMISLQASERMIDILKKQQLQDCLPALLPEQDPSIVGTIPAWEIAHKTGSVQGILHDAGILYVGQRKLAVVVLSKGLDKLTAQSVIQKIGLELYRYLKN